MSVKRTSSKVSKAGRKPMWGPRSPMTVHWPEEHRAQYERAAAEAGVSLNEYVIRRFAVLHGLIQPSEEVESAQLKLGA